MAELSHLDLYGKVRMADISDKKNTFRTAIAQAVILLKPSTFNLIKKDEIPKGNVLTTAKLAGILAGKKTPDLIPLCHTLLVSNIDISFIFDKKNSKICIKSKVILEGKTGVEMEALTAVSVAALTIYDMCKAVDKGMIISDIKLLKKSGGKSGNYVWKE